MKYKLPKEALQYHCSQRSPAMQHCRPCSTAHNSLLLFLSRLFRCIRLISSFEINCSSSLRSMSMFTTPLILSATSACNAASVCSCACRSSNLCIFVCRCRIRSSCATSERSAMKSVSTLSDVATGLDSDGTASCRALKVTAGIPSGEARSGLDVLSSGRAGEGLTTLCAAGTGP